MYIKVVNPRLTTEVTPGDIVQSGILISNSEVGMGSLAIQPLVYRLVCSNGMIVNDAKTRKYHVGRGNEAGDDFTLYTTDTMKLDDMALMAKVRDTVRAVVDQTRFEKVVAMMRQAKDAKIVSSNIPAMIELAGTEFGFTKQEGTGILDHLIKGGDLKTWKPNHTDIAGEGSEFEVVKMSNMRKLIAKSMYNSLQNSAQLTHMLGADARKIQALRKKAKKALEEGKIDANITINDFVCFAVIKALQKFPNVKRGRH